MSRAENAPDTDLLPQICKRADEIGRVLGLSLVRERVDGKLKQAFQRLVNNTRRAEQEGRTNNLYALLMDQADKIRPPDERELLSCLVLIDYLPRLGLREAEPPARPSQGSRTWEDLARFVLEMFNGCRNPAHLERIREELVQQLWSSFPWVRQFAQEMLRNEPVCAEEARGLLDARTPPDTRTTIAHRILNGRGDHYETLLDYLIRRIDEGFDRDPEEFEAARKMFPKLERFAANRDPGDVLLNLYLRYQAHYDNTQVRGWLLRALDAFGDDMVRQTVSILHQSPPRTIEDRRQALHLLAYMLSFGSELACQEYIALLPGIAEVMRDDYCQFLLERTGKMLSDWNPTHDGVIGLLEDFGDKLTAGSQDRRLRDLGERLRALRQEASVNDAMLDRLAQGQASTAECRRLERAAYKVAPFVVRELRNPTRPKEELARLIRFLGRLRGGVTNPEGLAAKLWDLFESGHDLGEEALRVLVKLELKPPGGDERVRTVLSQRMQRGHDRDQGLLNSAWQLWLPAAPRPRASPGAAGGTQEAT